MFNFEELKNGYQEDCDILVIGSGAGGSVAAFNAAKAGLKTIVVEAGPELKVKDMTRNAPEFMQKNLWEAGARHIQGSSQIPSLQAKVVGGSTVINSAIMLPLPDYVKREWASQHHLTFIESDLFEESYKRVFKMLKVNDTKISSMGKANLVARDTFKKMGFPGAPLPRAMQNCTGSGDCMIGCPSEKKQSVDRNYLPAAEKAGCQIFTCSQVFKIHHQGRKVTSVSGYVIDPNTKLKTKPFTITAKKVIVAAGAANTPALLLGSRLTGNGRVGKTFFAHLSGAVAGIMKEKTDPWIGATQAWGAMPDSMPGYKFETLWAPSSVITTRIKGFGEELYNKLKLISHTSLIVLNYRAKVKGSVRRAFNGNPILKLTIPDEEVLGLLKGIKLIADGFIKNGARYIMPTITSLPDKLYSLEDNKQILSKHIKASDIKMSGNHIFGSAPMGPTNRSPVELTGLLRGTDNLYIADASLFPSASGANPQATVMALSDLISRRLLGVEDYLISEKIA